MSEEKITEQPLIIAHLSAEVSKSSSSWKDGSFVMCTATVACTSLENGWSFFEEYLKRDPTYPVIKRHGFMNAGTCLQEVTAGILSINDKRKLDEEG